MTKTFFGGDNRCYFGIYVKHSREIPAVERRALYKKLKEVNATPRLTGHRLEGTAETVMSKLILDYPEFEGKLEVCEYFNL